MCGILGIVAPHPVGNDLVCGLTALQHRGQDAAGVVTLSDRFHMKKGAGLVTNVFATPADTEALQGHAGLGHVRYATQGTTSVFDAQPFAVHYPFGLAMVHNGNVTNFAALRQRLNTDHHRLIQTTNDVELILYTLAAELERKNLAHLTVDDLFASVRSLFGKVDGAYSVITLIAGKGMLAFRDANGIRPLIFGKRQTPNGPSYAFASESTCFDYLGYELVRELAPGEAVLVTRDGQVHSSGAKPACGSFCAFEFIYFAREDATMNGTLVARERVRAGKLLARRVREAGLVPDIVIDVPSSAYFAASGLAEELGIPYRRGLTKNNHVGRSFIVPSQVERERLVRQKLNPIREVVAGKKVAVVDDSIVRGTTSKHIVRLLRDAGAAEVYFCSAAPPILHRCVYGIDMATKKEIIAANHTLDEVRAYIGADAVVYQSLEDLKDVYRDVAGCFACFSGVYPTEVGEETLGVIEAERELRQSERVNYGALAGGR
ncbi:MAG: amidophosphoribosyltransferase [Deltaproteobacteria bacterium]|nr:amidophosphoribosyltransferase [Deltaproteobacteria bacterium]